MKKNYLPRPAPALGIGLMCLLVLLVITVPAGTMASGSFTGSRLLADYREIMSAIVTPDWQGSGQLFTMLQHNLFTPLFAAVLIVMLLLFAAHYLFIGAKEFSHEGKEIPYYSFLCRLVHAVAALSFTILTITGLMMIFGKFFSGGSVLRAARFLHAPAAVIFLPAALLLCLLWVRDMLPGADDLDWLMVFGGYLSKKKITVAAGKFNPGQKSWFWLAVIGGALMAYTGYDLFYFTAELPDIRLAAMIHNFLGVVLLAMFMIHLYMAIFAVRGSLRSMLTGKKSAEEVAMMHSSYYKQIS